MKKGKKKKGKNMQIKELEEFNTKKTEIMDKIVRVQNELGVTSIGGVEKFFNKLKLLWMCVDDYLEGNYTKIPFKTIIAIAGALIYFLSPADAIPDFIPGIGYIDDAAVVGMVIKAIFSDLENYAQWKKLDLDEYF
ncbi:Uncharacterized membrane protein YkvA, DUF1232 family [Candidatus Kryptobacter tengchongensis]|uniref:Uncharacterized membrane protein YkvA, DUF1232 family n=1 Tax=Kryptobacter tengchongensis TaxID=1643429 RepID=A0A656DB64_KRYT1|nr:Uncharacterized membrane protein YkvA, DUF1232 family [Candidatus Kryptobacter tengchongensis]CUU06391.1 Uncharacterized membrane protein YkvA, DUF1232 family [Candidatus Kryptobacter tengchongensis]